MFYNKLSQKSIHQLFTSKVFIVLTLIGNLFLLGIVTWVYFLERGTHSSIDSFFDALWWGVTTITTVGYGDIVPTHPFARWLGIILMYSGTLFFVAFTSLFASYWLRIEFAEEVEPIERELAKELVETQGIEQALSRIEHRLKALEERLK